MAEISRAAAGGILEVSAARPDAFRPDLAASLHNLPDLLGDLDRPEDALAAIQEATDTSRETAESRPDAFRPDLARSLHNLSNRLADLGRPQDALDAGEEAVTIRRELSARWPDAYRHELEQSLRVVAWLQHGESNASSTHPPGSPGRDNGPLSRPLPVSYFVAADTDQAEGHHRAH